MAKAPRILTGAELRYAVQHGLEVYYSERPYDRNDSPMHDRGPAPKMVDDYEVDVDFFGDSDLVESDADSCTWAIRAVKGVTYQSGGQS